MSTSRRRVAPIFTTEEDIKFLEIMETDPRATWRTVAEALNFTHTPRQCRDHWLTQLSPYEKTSTPMTEEDVELLFDLVSKYGLMWDLISKRFKGRTPNELKNAYLRSLMRRNKDSMRKAMSFTGSPIQMEPIETFNNINSIASMPGIHPIEELPPLQANGFKQREIFPLITPKTRVFSSGVMPKKVIIEKSLKEVPRFEFNMMSLMSMLNDVDVNQTQPFVA